MKRSLPLLLILALVLGACVPQVVRPQAPQVELLQFNLISLDPFSGRGEFDLRLRLTNPNGFSLPLLDSTLTAELGGTAFRLTLPALEIPAGASREAQTRLVVPLVEGTRVLAGLLAGQSTRFRLLGELRAQLGPAVVPIGPLTLLDREVRVQFAFQLPRIRLLEIRLDGLAIRLVLEVENPNPVGFTLEGPLRLLIGGRGVAETAFNMRLSPNERRPNEVRLGLSGFPGAGGLSVELGLRAYIPGILERLVAQVLQGILR
ncbi:LEA type 2 family protein [Meiothermus rufus]|uniref:NDR1/HIN1-like protein n=1 Tax=Meiothermus rufus TaxID=604332 RepID=UPI0004054E6F|nr:LEA type 2 family protein [Meiothermus rufus]